MKTLQSFDVNKSIQRSLTKALARHGLGLYLYAGEDLPEIEIEKISVKDAKILQNVVKNFNEPDKLYATLLRRYNVQSFKELTVKQRVEILEGLNQMAKNREVQNGDKVHSTGQSEGQTATSNVQDSQ